MTEQQNSKEKVGQLSDGLVSAYYSWAAEAHKWAGGDHEKSAELLKKLEEAKALYTECTGYDANNFVEELQTSGAINDLKIVSDIESRDAQLSAHNLTAKLGRDERNRQRLTELNKQYLTLKNARQQAEQNVAK